MRKPVHTALIACRISETLLRRVEETAHQREMSVSELMRHALRGEIARGQPALGSRAAQIAEQRLPLDTSTYNITQTSQP